MDNGFQFLYSIIYCFIIIMSKNIFGISLRLIIVCIYSIFVFANSDDYLNSLKSIQRNCIENDLFDTNDVKKFKIQQLIIEKSLKFEIVDDLDCFTVDYLINLKEFALTYQTASIEKYKNPKYEEILITTPYSTIFENYILQSKGFIGTMNDSNIQNNENEVSFSCIQTILHEF